MIYVLPENESNDAETFDLKAFAEHHYQMGVILGRAEMLREIVDIDEKLFEERLSSI